LQEGFCPPYFYSKMVQILGLGITFPYADYLQGSFPQMVQSPAIEKEILRVL